ncbi:MAG: cell division control protein 6, partial [Methanoregula sp.]|nr:cell division control protein 6 [Methanoregula sp.]
LRFFAERSLQESEMNAGDVYKSIKESLSIGYTRFYEIVKKMDALRLINLQYREGKGRTRIITLRYEPAKVLERLS